MTESTYNSLVKKYGCKIIPLDDIVEFTGCKTVKSAREKANNQTLPFPAFKPGGKNGTWFVNAEHLAEYLDMLDRDSAQSHRYFNSSPSPVRQAP